MIVFFNCISSQILDKSELTGAMSRNMQEDTHRSPSYTVTCEDYVHVVEFSPFSSGTPLSLLAYGGNQFVVVASCIFQVRNAASVQCRQEFDRLEYVVFYLLLYIKMCLLSSQEEDKEIKGVDFNILQAFHHEVRVDALAWSPESRLDRVPNIR